MPSESVLLTDLSPAEIRLCAAAYDALHRETASFKTRNGRSFPVTFGSTGAAKTLFALCPNVFLPWDGPFRGHQEVSGDLESFRVYLTDVTEQLRLLASEAGAPVSALPTLVGRPDSSPPKLIDEYNWVTITKGRRPTN